MKMFSFQDLIDRYQEVLSADNAETLHEVRVIWAVQPLAGAARLQGFFWDLLERRDPDALEVYRLFQEVWADLQGRVAKDLREDAEDLKEIF